MRKLGKKLKKLRIENKLSLAKVQHMTGITDTRLKRIEDGNIFEPSPFTLKKLAKLYNVNVIEFYQLAGYLDIEDLIDYKLK